MFNDQDWCWYASTEEIEKETRFIFPLRSNDDTASLGTGFEASLAGFLGGNENQLTVNMGKQRKTNANNE